MKLVLSVFCLLLASNLIAQKSALEDLLWKEAGGRIDTSEDHGGRYEIVDDAKNGYLKVAFTEDVSEELYLTIYVLENNIEDYLTSLTWDPNEKYVYAANLSRNQKELHLKQYNAQNGDFITEILSEKNEKYVHPMHPMYFVGKQDFLWMSEKSGFMNLYKVNMTNGSWTALTEFGFPITFIDTGRMNDSTHHSSLVHIKFGAIESTTIIEHGHHIFQRKVGSEKKSLITLYSIGSRMSLSKCITGKTGDLIPDFRNEFLFVILFSAVLEKFILHFLKLLT